MPRTPLELCNDRYSVCDELPHDSKVAIKIPQPSLFLLPAEILEKIFNYLNPPDLVSVGKLGDKRIKEISLSKRSADFSRCNTVQPIDVSTFFTKDRVLHIREINFNNLFFLHSFSMENSIVKCKHLRKLSVYNCGLSLKSINSIFKSCKELEELYWTVSVNRKHHYDFEKVKPLKLKKLYLNLRKRISGNVNLRTVIAKSVTADEVCINISPYFTSTLPPCVGRKIFVCNMPQTYDRFITNVFNRISHEYAVPTTKYLKNMVAVPSFAKKLQECVTGGEEEVSCLFLSDSAYLQVFTEKDQLNAISAFPPNSVTTLVMFMTDRRLCLAKHIEKLKQITGRKLQQLVVNKSTKNFIPANGQEDEFEAKIQCDFIIQMTSTCLNIQVLNLSEIHFNEAFCFKPFCDLKNLKIITLPACILRPSGVYLFPEKEDLFEEFVSQCNKVEIFSFYGCHNCNCGPHDVKLMAIAKWPKLTRLLFSKVRTFRFCDFLSHVADSCPDLTSLEIVELGLSVCLFVPSVMHVLRKSKQLKFLRINQISFNPVNLRFWESVAMAQNLQGLCLSYDTEHLAPKNMITDALKMLPFFHLFHLSEERLTNGEEIFFNVYEIMKANNVKDKRINLPIHELARDEVECLAAHFPF